MKLERKWNCNGMKWIRNGDEITWNMIKMKFEIKENKKTEIGMKWKVNGNANTIKKNWSFQGRWKWKLKWK